MKKTILLIEDEEAIRRVLRHNLSREGYRVLESGDGEGGLEKARSQAPDLVVLDLMLPGLDGISVCRRLKADPLTASIPVLMLTAKGEEADVVLGLGVGADDYVVKPFRLKEFLARVEAVLRRGPAREELVPGERVVRGDLVVDAARHKVKVGKRSLDLTATEFRLLHYLAAHPGRVFTRDMLLSRVIGENAIVVDRNIDVHIRSIRKKLGQRRDLIETVRGVGYRFREEEP